MRIENFIIKYRLAIIIIFPILTLLFAFGLMHLEIEPDINDMIPSTMASRIQTDHIESIFDSNNLIVVVLETDDVLDPTTLKRVKTLTRVFQRHGDIERVTSLYTLKQIKNENGAMIVDPAVKRTPISMEARETLRTDLRSNTLAYGTVVSGDFTKTAILLTPKKNIDDNDLVQKIEVILQEVGGSEKIYTGGLPVVNATIIKDIFKDVVYLLPIGFIFMTAMLYFAFKQMRGVLLPFGAVLMAIILSFGLMPLLGWKIAIVTILMPVILIAVANDYGIHMVAKYNELLEAHPEWSKKELARQTFNSLKYPILITGITTVVGILGLFVHIIVHARQLGLLASLGITWAVALSLLFIPATLSYLPKRTPKKKIRNGKHQKRLLDKLLPKLSRFIIGHPKKIVIISLLLSLIIALGIFNLKIDGNVENFFKENHTVKVSSKLINENFGGAQTLSILFEGDIKDPALLKRMEAYENNLLENPDIGKVTSVVNAIKEISKGLYDSENSLYDRIPDTKEAVAQYMELYYMNGDPDDFEQLIDFDYKKAQMIIRINKADGYIIKNVVKQIKSLTRDDPNVTMLGGEALIKSDMNLAIVNGQVKSLTLAIVAIMIILMIVFRSFWAGIFASLPLLLAESILFGLMGYFQVRLDAATALLSSVMIGVGIDYTIHFLWRYRDEYRESGSMQKGIQRALQGSGKGIIFNAWSVIVGFAALVFSSFLPIQYFGFLVVISITVCLVAALVLVPAMCLIFKPKFLEPKESL
ncbi:MAG: MMPL family transporter [Candidatus Marinimicrobia bacterium]|nr:MMPL family transporter [Candidatus Neomarinimicrobiota bacterium]